MRLFLYPGMGGIAQRARKAVRICPWMDGIAQRARDGDAHMPWMDGIAQRARDGDAHMPWMDGIAQGARKAMRIGLTLLLIQTALANTALADTACPATQFDEKSLVLYAYDGDTLHLKDGRKVRLIGINTPEVGHDHNAAEPFANEAKAALKSLFKNDKSISLIYGKEKKDHYQRLLAHAFTSDGRNLQAILLANGLARVITFPPNTQFTACYLTQERTARCSKTGLWKTAITLEAKSLDKSSIGFHLVEGKLNSININEKGIWLNLDNELTVGIRPENRQLFEIDTLYSMLNKKVVVRGWINKNKKNTSFYMRIRHPASIQLLTDFACK